NKGSNRTEGTGPSGARALGSRLPDQPSKKRFPPLPQGVGSERNRCCPVLACRRAWSGSLARHRQFHSSPPTPATESSRRDLASAGAHPPVGKAARVFSCEECHTTHKSQQDATFHLVATTTPARGSVALCISRGSHARGGRPRKHTR